MKTKILFLILLLNNLQIVAQSPWAKGKSKTYFQVGYSNLSYDKVRYNNQTLDAGSKISDQTFQIYTEHGLSKKLDVIAIIPLKLINSTNSISKQEEKMSALGNIQMGLKYLVFDKNWKIASGIVLSANSTEENESNGLRSGFNATTILPFISAGSSYKKFYFYGNVGYGYMNKNYSDFIKLTAELGYEALPKFHVIVNAEMRKIASKENAYLLDNVAFANTALYLDQQEYLATSFKLNYEFKKESFGANASFNSAFSLNNIAAAPVFNLGIYKKW